MAGVKLSFNSRLRASSVMEVVISMIVILVVFTTAMMIAANVMRASPSAQKLQARALLNDLMAINEKNEEVESATLTLGNFQVKQDIKNYQNEPGLIDIHLIAYDSNHQEVAELEKVLIKR